MGFDDAGLHRVDWLGGAHRWLGRRNSARIIRAISPHSATGSPTVWISEASSSSARCSAHDRWPGDFSHTRAEHSSPSIICRYIVASSGVSVAYAPSKVPAFPARWQANSFSRCGFIFVSVFPTLRRPTARVSAGLVSAVPWVCENGSDTLRSGGLRKGWGCSF